MAHSYTREELWEIYRSLPEKLQEVIFSNDTAITIQRIGERNSIDETKISHIATIVGNVLMGINPPEEAQALLEKDAGLKKDKATGVAQELRRLLFYPLRKELQEIHGQREDSSNIDTTKSSSPVAAQKPKKNLSSTPSSLPKKYAKQKQERDAPDPYREIPE